MIFQANIHVLYMSYELLTLLLGRCYLLLQYACLRSLGPRVRNRIGTRSFNDVPVICSSWLPNLDKGVTLKYMSRNIMIIIIY